MPVTPLHIGPALLLKRAAGSRFSLSSFDLSQVLLDIEPGLKLTGLLTEGAGLHLSHTWSTGAVVGLVAAAASAWGCRWVVEGCGWRWRQNPSAWSSVLGAALGVLSHLGLDAVYHADVAASIGLPVLNGVVSQGWLDAGLLVALVAGCLALLDKKPVN